MWPIFHRVVFLLDEYFSIFSSPPKCFFTVNKKGQKCSLTTLASSNSDCLTFVDIECGVHKENSGWVLSKHRKAFDFGRRMVGMNHVKKHSWLVVPVVIMMDMWRGFVQIYNEIGCVQVIWETTPCNNYTWGTAGLATDGPRVRQTCSCIKRIKKMRRLQYHQLILHCTNCEKMKRPSTSPDTVCDRRAKQGEIQRKQYS